MTREMTKKDYERLLLANENELWAMTERNAGNKALEAWNRRTEQMALFTLGGV